jgi:hypothetical protein
MNTKQKALTLILICLSCMSSIGLSSAQIVPETDIYTLSFPELQVFAPVTVTVKYLSSPTFSINGTSFGNTAHQETHASDPGSGIDTMIFNASAVDTYNITFTCSYEYRVKQSVQIYISQTESGHTMIQQVDMNSRGFMFNMVISAREYPRQPSKEEMITGVTQGIWYQLQNEVAKQRSQADEVNQGISGVAIIAVFGGVFGAVVASVCLIVVLNFAKKLGKLQGLREARGN